MTKTWLILATAMFALGCDTQTDDTGTSGTSGTTDTTCTGTTTTTGTTTSGTSLDCVWDSAGIDVMLFYGDDAGYNFGVAETDCGGGGCWTGEDCMDGYTAGDGTVYAYCHPLSCTGGYLTTVSSFDSVVEGSTTVHSAALNNTYFIEEVATGDCWVWGYDASYYGALGCYDIGGPCTGE